MTSSSDRPMSPNMLLSNMIPAPSERPQRSGSWWKRLSVSGRSRNNSLSSRTGVGSGFGGYTGTAMLRDPNPPPRLVTIDEAASSQLSPGSKRSSPGMLTPRTGNTPPGEVPPPAPPVVATGNVAPRHGKSTSSLRTTDTDLIDRMAGTMDVAYREQSGSGNSGTPSIHRQWRNSTDSVGDASSFASVGRGGAPARQGSGSSSNLVLSPTEMDPHESIASASMLPVIPPRTHSPTRVPPISMYNKTGSGSTGNSPVSPTSPSGGVAAKIQEFEKKHRQSVGSVAEMDKEKKRRSGVVDYGLVPRRSLFVANPDHRKSQSSLESS